MICYKDKTFCTYNVICKNSFQCDRLLTKEIKEEAIKSGLPVAVYTDFPDCFVRWFEPDNNKQETKCRH